MLRSIGPGDVGPEVRDIQSRLSDLGYSCQGDEPAVFASSTERAVRAFQQRRGLTADGTVGQETWRELVEAGRTLGDRRLYLTDPMLRGDDVRDLQRRLNRLGFDAGYVDGVFGPGTAEAVREFELNYGLRVDGIVGNEVVGALLRLHRHHQSASASAVREREALRRTAPRPTLTGARILLDPGHGPDDPGHVAPNGRAEHEINWEIASRIEGRLLARGAQAILSRGPANTPTASQRARLANAENVEAIVSIHCNGLPSPSARGAAAYYFGDGTFVSEAGRAIANLAVDRIVDLTGAPHCRTHPSTSVILRESRAPAVVIEPGFLTHHDEGLRLQDPAHQERVADALTDALLAYLTGRIAPERQAS